MSFELTTVHGTVEELGSDLAAPPLHEREEFVVEEVKKAIYHVVSSLGGYLSVSCNGNINPVAGETGDVINIYITSLPQPDSAPVETPVATAPGIATGEPTPVTEESQPVQLVEAAPGEAVINGEVVTPVQQETAPSESVEAPVNTGIGPSGPDVNAPEITPAISTAEPIRIEPPAAPAPQGDPLVPPPADA